MFVPCFVIIPFFGSFFGLVIIYYTSYLKFTYYGLLMMFYCLYILYARLVYDIYAVKEGLMKMTGRMSFDLCLTAQQCG